VGSRARLSARFDTAVATTGEGMCPRRGETP
jgi:hypothetical protein